MVIWKYSLGTPDVSIGVPKGARVLCVQLQNNKPTLWMEVNPTNPEERRHFVTVPTGDGVPTGKYIGTVQFSNGLVFHTYEVI